MTFDERVRMLLERQGGICACCKGPMDGVARVCYPTDADPVVVTCPVCDDRAAMVRSRLGEYRNILDYLDRIAVPRSWDGYFLRGARLAATMSKDPSSQVGAVLVRDRQVIATGFNGFPRGVNDDVPERWDRPLKYQMIVHAEENCLLSAARNGARTDGTTLYVTPLFPCSRCATSIVQAGVRCVVTSDHKRDNPRWREEFEQASVILSEGGVVVRGPEK